MKSPKPLFEYKQHPMTEEQSKLLLMLLSTTDEMRDKFVTDLQQAWSQAWGMLEYRLKVNGVLVTPTVLAYVLLALNVTTPGIVNLWATTFKAIWEKHDKNEVTMDMFVHSFAHGYPNAEVYEQAYEEAKANVE